MAFLVKCSCGNCDKQNAPGNVEPCSRCGKSAMPVCAACGGGIYGQDAKDCKGMLVHSNINCWNSYWANN
jgi:hypothetical protein